MSAEQIRNALRSILDSAPTTMLYWLAACIDKKRVRAILDGEEPTAEDRAALAEVLVGYEP